MDHLFGAPGAWDLRRCANRECGLLWLDPMPAADELSKAYASYYTHGESEGRPASGLRQWARNLGEAYLAHRYGYRAEPLSRWYRAMSWLIFLHPGARANLDFSVFYLSALGGRLLEIGLGSGRMLSSMRGRGWQVEGVDTDPAAVRIARARSLEVHHGTLEERRFPTSSFDAIVMGHVIEHVSDPLSLMRECRRLIKPQGKLVIITPNSDSWGHKLYKQYWRGLEPPRHLYIFNCRALRILAEKAEFKKYELSTTIRDANGVFLASEHIRKVAKGSAPPSAPPRNAYYRARIMQLIEWVMLKFHPELGDEIVLIATR
ncbi:MAG: class I SAM-dependent methyltransferase [Gammaproteobacteria bacterium]